MIYKIGKSGANDRFSIVLYEDGQLSWYDEWNNIAQNEVFWEFEIIKQILKRSDIIWYSKDDLIPLS
jgi:hypothetical protein